MLGVGRADLQDKIATALSQLPIQSALVVRGEDGMDEVSLSSPTRVLHVTPGSVTPLIWTADQFGFDTIDPNSLYAADPADSARVIREVLSGKQGPARDIVLVNAAAGVWLTKREPTMKAAIIRCEQAIDSGSASRLVDALARETQT